MRASNDTILAGSFSDFSFPDVIHVASLSRQILQIVTNRPNGASCVMQLKSGQLLACQAPSLEDPSQILVGVPAFHSLLREPGLQFVVTRQTGPIPETPLGEIAKLIAELPADKRIKTSKPAPTPITAGAQAGQEPTRRPSREISKETPDAARQTRSTPQIPASQGSTPQGATPAPTEREIIAQGQFSEFSMKDVLATVALTRQTVELITRDAQGPRGGMLIKGGQILDVRTKQPSRSAREAFNDLLASPGESFAIFRRTAPTQHKPLGSLAEWVADAQRVVPIPVRKILIDGMLNQFPLADVFSVLSTSRQRMVLELWESGRPRGRMVVKANMVLEVTTVDQRSGEAALRAIISSPGDRFVIATEPSTRATTAVLGALDQLLAQINRSEPPPSGRTGPIPAQSAPPPQSAPSHTTSSEQLLLEGDLTDFTIPEILSVMTLSRNCLELRIKRWNSSGAVLRVKAGQVLGASLDGERDPVRVLHALITSPNESFSVVRVPSPAGAISAGALDLLFMEAQNLGDQAATVIDLEIQDPSLRDPSLRDVPSKPMRESPSKGRSEPPAQPPPRKATPVVLPERARHPAAEERSQPTPAPMHAPVPSHTPVPISGRIIEDRPTLIPTTIPNDPRIEGLEQINQRLTERIANLEAALENRQVEDELNEALVLLRMLEKRIEEQHSAIEAAKSAPRGSGDFWLTALVLAVQLFTVIAVTVAVGLSVFPWNP